MKKLISVLILVALLTAIFAGCAPGSQNTKDGKMTISVAGLGGGFQSFPIYLAEKYDWFEEENLEVNVMYFENGPVQVEAISEWDVATTGIGGILAGALSHDAQVIATQLSDGGTQRIFARKDSPIVAAGQGHNELHPDIYGDAESWKGQKVLCTAGNILQYVLNKTLSGVGVSPDEIEFVSMDIPTANSAFLAGEGDVVCLNGTVALSEDKEDYVLVSLGSMVELGTDNYIMANQESVEDKHEEILAFLRAYFRAAGWVANNREEAVNDLIAFCEETGKELDRRTAEIYLEADGDFYTLEDNYTLLNSADGTQECELERRILDVMNFYVGCGNYKPEDAEKLKGHVNNEFINELCEEK